MTASDVSAAGQRLPRLRQLVRPTLDRLALGPALARDLWIDRETDLLRLGPQGALPLGEISDLRLLAIGKAARPMLEAAWQQLVGSFGDRLRQPALLVAPAGAHSDPTAGALPPLRTFDGGHPIPNAASAAAAEAALELVAGADETTLVLLLLSGGGSALCEQPILGSIEPADLRPLAERLVTCGASIVEMNALRKHLSRIKGGRLAAAAQPATVWTLFVSDVPDDRPDAVASGPTFPDPSTLDDALAVARRYELLDLLSAPLRVALEAKTLPETPKPGDAIFHRAHFHRLLGGAEGLEALRRQVAADLGLPTVIDTSVDDWPVEAAVDHLLQRLFAERERLGGPVALITGGELSVEVRGTGRGGRNQAFVLEVAARIEGKPIGVLSFGTDGRDGNSPAAGAVADGTSVQRARAAGFDLDEVRARSDAYGLFSALGDAVETGSTGQNVRDLRLLTID